ncbi:hypothetical protein Psta_0528 [Pirellula staleyi DSM 6068]|uniref:Uncharacterized protein n=1 Tax=Pirellula staleyi (strain ATCC 27377 / DSM 6068 / ICPB 4128) TaxID=530564 RepID=D2R3I4_PIRSD|nr:hypothetical protein Psta_0528 [Pirellula staleyi DSM 6068]
MPLRSCLQPHTPYNHFRHDNRQDLAILAGAKPQPVPLVMLSQHSLLRVPLSHFRPPTDLFAVAPKSCC